MPYRLQVLVLRSAASTLTAIDIESLLYLVSPAIQPIPRHWGALDRSQLPGAGSSSQGGQDGTDGGNSAGPGNGKGKGADDGGKSAGRKGGKGQAESESAGRAKGSKGDGGKPWLWERRAPRNVNADAAHESRSHIVPEGFNPNTPSARTSPWGIRGRHKDLNLRVC